MKKKLSGFLILCFCLTLSGYSIGEKEDLNQISDAFQDEIQEYDFRIVKTYEDKRIAYFDILNIKDENHRKQIIAYLMHDENIEYVSIYDSKKGGYKCQITTKLNINASYVMNILKVLKVDIHENDLIAI